MSVGSRRWKAVAIDQAGRKVPRCRLQEALEGPLQVPEFQQRHFPEPPKVGFPQGDDAGGGWGHSSYSFPSPSEVTQF